MMEPPNEGPDDWYFDEHSQQWLRHSGRAHWRRVLAEKRAQHAADPDSGRRWLRERFGITLTDSGQLIVATMARMEPETSTTEPARPPRASERFMSMLGKPAPEPMTAEQRADFDARMEQADADLLARIERRNSGRSAA